MKLLKIFIPCNENKIGNASIQLELYPWKPTRGTFVDLIFGLKQISG